ncbi:TipJ family phage tail tip protein [Stenotrophomonas lacuserhaii]|uniref:TipJ family phage tail tip protein n=1 Tax=Stenotrophomonas lacuserhaii TaxID=2760084 RepID=UPI0015F7C04A|nr:hypothetical protein [Stenotrophomonas lacuserhaii]
MTQNHSLNLYAHEFAPAGVFEVRGGQSLCAMLQEACGSGELASSLDVRVGGYQVPVEMWERLRPKQGAIITVVRTDLAGGGGGLLRSIAMIAVSVAAIWVTGGAAVGLLGSSFAAGTFGAAALGAGVTIAGSLLVNALIPPPTPGGGSFGGDLQYNQLTGSSNQAMRWGPIPIVLGESRFFPPHAAVPYSENVGSDSYQRLLFDLGYGDLEVSDIKIGDNALSTYSDVQYEITKTPTLYTNDVNETAVGFTLDTNGDNTSRTSAPGIDTLSLDLLFPQGLIGYGTSSSGPGDGFEMWVLYRIQYRPTGTSSWLNVTGARLSKMVTQWVPGSGGQRPNLSPGPGLFLVKTRSKAPFSAGLAWDLPNGQYDVRVERISALRGGSANTYIDTATWTLLRSIRNVNPSTTGTTKLAMRIKATDQLTGLLQSLSCMVRQKIPVYDRNTGIWSAPQVSLNPAWVSYWIMTSCPAVKRHVPASRIDLDSFADHAEFCRVNGFETRMTLDAVTTVRDLLVRVLGGGLGSPGNRDGRYCVVFDPGVVSYPRMAFSPVDIESFSDTTSYLRMPDALRVQFRNPNADWKDDEIIVLRDGFSYRGVDARGNPSSAPQATEFETMKVDQSMLPQQAWRMGRYHLAQAEFRRTSYSFSPTISGLSTTRGDVVDVGHDYMEWGAGSGRVIGFIDTAPAGYAGTITLDTMIDTDPSKQYGIQIRKAMGEPAVLNVEPHSAYTDTFYIPEGTALPTGVSRDDMAIVGLRGQETVRLLVTGVTYTADFMTSFTATNYDERVDAYWRDPPDSIISEVTGTVLGAPEPPVISAISTVNANNKTDDAGIATPVVRINLTNKPGFIYEALR